MRSPTSMAREVAGAIYVAMHSDKTWAATAWDDMGGSEPTEERALLELAALDLIRARDAEVRADERAKVLAGFEWETRDDGMEFYPRPRYGIRQRRAVSPYGPSEESR